MKMNKITKISAVVLSVIMLFTFLNISEFAYFDNYHVNTGTQAQDIVAVAKTQIGYKEGSLEGTVQGSNDYTKYGVWYGSAYARVAWCAIFVSWCANQAGISTSVIPKFASCDAGMEWFYNHGRFAPSENYGGWAEPQVGDIVFFGYQLGDGSFDSTHVGIVYKVDDDKIYSLEGNSSMRVQSVPYNRVGSNYGTYIIGYGRPDYGGSYWLPNTPDQRCVSASTTAMYSRASTSSSHLYDIPYGTQLYITEYSSIWGKTYYGGAEGWVLLEDCNINFDSFIVRFRANGGTGAPSAVVKYQQGDVTLPDTRPTREGYTFEGWALSPDAIMADYYPGMPFTVNEDTTLYAVWQPLTPDITYNVGVGGIVERVVFSNTVTFIINSKPGYVFSCMTLDGRYVNAQGWETFKYYDVESANPHHFEFAFESVWLNGVNPYIDIGTGWYYEAVVSDFYSGLMRGTSEGHFTPNSELTRAELVTVMANMFVHDGGEILDCPDVPFTDIDRNAYYYKYLCWAYEYGVVSGVSVDSFQPDRAITREEFAVMVYRYNYSITGRSTTLYYPIISLYDDYYNTSSWARVSMLWCLNNLYLCGIDGSVLPQSSLTRAQCAQILKNYYR